MGVIITLIVFVFFLSIWFNLSLYHINKELYKHLEMVEEKGVNIAWSKAKYKDCFNRAMELLKK